MESQFTLFEKPESKGIKDIGAHVPQYTECESLENSYGDYLRHCNRVKSQARLPNEILDTFRQQIASGMDNQIVLGLLYCILTNHNPSCNYPWDYLKDLNIVKKTIVTNAVMKLMDDYILYITADALGQVFWFLEQVLKSKFNGGDTNGFVTQTIICVMRHIDVNRVTRYSLNLSQSVQKFIFNHLDWMVELNQTTDRIFIYQVIYLFLRLIENHDHADLQKSRKEEVRFVSRLFDKFPDCWTGIGRDFARLFQHLYPIESFTQYWGLIDNESGPSKLVQILAVPTHPVILQVCIDKQEQKDLVQLCNEISIQKDQIFIQKRIEQFVDKYLKRNKFAEHCCDVIRFVMACYNQPARSITSIDDGLPNFTGKDVFLFHLLFYFFVRDWKNEVRGFIWEAMLMEVLYCRPTDKMMKGNMAMQPCCSILDQVLHHGSSRHPPVTANFLIYILETVRYYKGNKGMNGTKGNVVTNGSMNTLPFDSVIHFFKTSPNQCHRMVNRKEFSEKYMSLVQQFKREFETLYRSQPGTPSASPPSGSKMQPKVKSPKMQRNTKVKLEYQDNIRSTQSIPSQSPSPSPHSSSSSPIIRSPVGSNSLFPTTDYKGDINRVRMRMAKMLENEEPFKSSPFCMKLTELKQPLINYYTLKLIEMAQCKNDKMRRNLTQRIHDILKSLERSTNQLLNAFLSHSEALHGPKRKLFTDRFARGMVDILAMDSLHCFLTPDKLSPIWTVVMQWASMYKKTKSPKSRVSSSSSQSGSEWNFDFNEGRIALLHAMCEYKADIKYVILLYDSKQPEAKGFIKHLGVSSRKRRHCSSIHRRLNAMHSWNRNQVDGVKVNAHPHGLFYGRRPFESVVCDLCEKDWNGSSWHCSNRACDFDTCHDCFVSFLERKQLYRAVLHLRKNGNNKMKKSPKSLNASISELLVGDIRALQTRSSVLLSALHQYLFYSYSDSIHPHIMEVLQTVLEVINPLQIQSLCKDIQLALFQLFRAEDVVQSLPKYIEHSLQFPQYMQLSFWMLLNAFLRTRNNADELYIKSLKYMVKLKRQYLKHQRNNGGENAMNSPNGSNGGGSKGGLHPVDQQSTVWITATAMNGMLDWTQIVHKSKRIEEMYDALLSFPCSVGMADDDDPDNNGDGDGDGGGGGGMKKELRSDSPSTTVFNASSSSFDEFHIQALVQLLSLKSPKWKSWLQTKLKSLRSKYEQKQAKAEENEEFVSLNKVKRRNNSNALQCNVAMDRHDEQYLLNLLKFYEYLTFVEPNMAQNAVSEMAKSFLYDADQRQILVRFFEQFASMSQFLEELHDFWPPESSKSATPQQRVLLSPTMTTGGSRVAHIIQGERSTADRLKDLEAMSSSSASKSTDKFERKRRTNRRGKAFDDSEVSSSMDSDDSAPKPMSARKRSKTVEKKKRDKMSRAPASVDRMTRKKSYSSDSSTSSSGRRRKTSSPARSPAQSPGRGTPSKRRLDFKSPRSPAPRDRMGSKERPPSLQLPSPAKENSPMDLIPKRKTKTFSVSANRENTKRPRMHSIAENAGNGNRGGGQPPPSKKRKLGSAPSLNSNHSMLKSSGLKRSVSGSNGAAIPKSSGIKRSVSSSSGLSSRLKSGTDRVNGRNSSLMVAGKSETNSPLKRSPRKRQRQIQDSSDEEGSLSPRPVGSTNGNKSPSRSPSQSRSFDEDDDDDDEEDSLANKYSSSSRSSKTTSNPDDGKVESWL